MHVDHWRSGIGTKLAINVAKILIEEGYNAVTGSIFTHDVQINAFCVSLGASVVNTKKTWLPVGIPEGHPDAVCIESSSLVVKDLKQALLQLPYPKYQNDADELYTYKSNAAPSTKPQPIYKNSKCRELLFYVPAIIAVAVLTISDAYHIYNK